MPGLFLTGSGTHPIAGINGMPGKNAADTMIKFFRKEDREGKSNHATAQARAQEAIES